MQYTVKYREVIKVFFLFFLYSIVSRVLTWRRYCKPQKQLQWCRRSISSIRGFYLWESCSLTLPAVSGSSGCGQSAHLPANQWTTAQILETDTEKAASADQKPVRSFVLKQKKAHLLYFLHARLWNPLHLELRPTALHTHKHGLCPTYSHCSHVQNSIPLHKSAGNEINLTEHYTMAVKDSC